MLDHQIILPLEEEETDLALHSKLCSQRYQQLLTKIDQVDHRLDKLESYVVDIKESIHGMATATNSTYLKWAGVVIGLLSTAIIGLVLHAVK